MMITVGLRSVVCVQIATTIFKKMYPNSLDMYSEFNQLTSFLVFDNLLLGFG